MSGRKAAATAALLAAVVAALYANGLDGSFHYDDIHSIVDNPHVRSWRNAGALFTDPGTFSGDPAKAMYRPLLVLSYVANYAWDGYDAAAFRTVNIALHAVCVILLWQLGLTAGLGPRPSLLAAVLLALQPLASEPVNYISSRSESLCAALVLGTVILYGQGCRRGRSVPFLPAAAVTLGAALLVKEVAVVTPAVLLAGAFWGPWERLAAGRRTAPGWGGLAVMGAVAVAFVGLYLALSPHSLHQAGQVRGAATQLATQLKAAPYYLRLVLLPVGLNVEHQFAVAPSLLQPAAALAGLLVLSLLGLGALALPRRQRIWGVWIVAFMAPTVLVPLNVLVNEHRLYLPVAGLCLLAAPLLLRVGRRPWAPYVGAGVLMLWAALVVQRNAVWENELTLWADAARRAPMMPRAQVHHGLALLQQGDRTAARRAFSRALALDPEHPAARTNMANLHLEAAQRDPDAAEVELRRAMANYQQVLAGDPYYPEALNSLGSAQLLAGRPREARNTLRRAVERYPHFAAAHYNLGLAARACGEKQMAVAHLQRAAHLEPDPGYWAELAALQVELGQLAAAATAFREAIRLEPQLVAHRYNLAQVLLVLGERARTAGQGDVGAAQWREARQHLEWIVARHPSHPAAARLQQLQARQP